MKKYFIGTGRISAILLVSLFILVSGTVINGQAAKVKFVRGDHKVDVMIGGKMFNPTSTLQTWRNLTCSPFMLLTVLW